MAVLGLCGLVLAGLGISGQLMPRRFTAAQRARIEGWEIAARWRTTPKDKIFPAKVPYDLAGDQIGVPGSLDLTARRLGIARQATCAKAIGAAPPALSMLDRNGCQALLRATYTDATSSLVLTVGVAVLRNQRSAISAAHYLTGSLTAIEGAQAKHLLLRPVSVPDSPASAFAGHQRQLSWVVGSGSYLVLATAGYADGRPRVALGSDPYTMMEMASLARGVATDIAGPLGSQPALPHCPGERGC